MVKGVGEAEDVASAAANGWTLDTLQAHISAMRKADERLDSERERFNTERPPLLGSKH